MSRIVWLVHNTNHQFVTQSDQAFSSKQDWFHTTERPILNDQDEITNYEQLRSNEVVLE